MSFVNKNVRVFKEAGDVEIARKRSDGRMKTYQSATDARAWCDIRENRRQYILDLIKQGDKKGLSLGKYIPIEAIIDILLSNKNADIKRLEQEIEILKQFIRDHGLTVPDLTGDSVVVVKEGPGGKRSKRSAGPGTSGESSDESYATGKGSPRRRQISPEDQMAAKELLDGKSPEDQVDALRIALDEKENLYALQQAIASAAVEELENIKDITDGKDSGKNAKLRMPSSTLPTSLSQSRKVQISEDTDADNDEEQLENDEKDNRQEKSAVPSSTPGDLRAETNNLKTRFEKLEGLEDAVRKLKKECAAGDTLADKQKEIDDLRNSLRELEILRVERNCLKMRVEDLCKVQGDYEDLLKKTQGFDALKAECATLKARCEELQDLEAEVNELRIKCQRAEELENERQLLMKEIEDCECCMNNQEDEIKRLACHIECLTHDLDKRQDQMKVKVLTLRAHLEKKDSIINKSEQQLADVQDQLRNSIENLSCETLCLRHRIEELEEEITQYENKIKKVENKIADYKNKVKTYENKVKEYETDLSQKEENNKALLEKLENEKSTTAKLEEALKKAIINDEHLKQMLKQAKCAIKCIAQKLENQDIVDMAKVEEMYMSKIKELENALASGDGSEERTKGLMDENEELRARLKELEKLGGQAIADENEQLRKLVEQLQGGATQEDLLAKKDQTIEDLRKELFALRQQMDKDKMGLEETEAAMKRLSKSGDSDAAEIARLKAEIDKLKGEINAKGAEIEKLHNEMENQKKQLLQTEEKLKEKQDLEAKMRDLETELKRLQTENVNWKGEIDRLRKEEAENLKSASGIANEVIKLNEQINKSKKDLEEKDRENKNLKDELNRLKQELAAAKAAADKNQTTDSENKDLKDQLNKLQKELAAQGGMTKESSKERDDLLKQIEAQKKEIADLLNKMKQPSSTGEESLVKDLQSKNEENKKLKDSIADLERQLRDLQKAQVTSVPKGSPEVDKVMNDLRDNLEKQEKKNSELEDALKKCRDECENLRKKNADLEKTVKEDADLKNKYKALEQELARQKEESNATIASLKDQFDRDIKGLQQRSNAAIDKLQKSQQEAVNNLSKQHEEEAASLKEKLRESKKTKSSEEVEKPRESKKTKSIEKVEKRRGSETSKSIEEKETRRGSEMTKSIEEEEKPQESEKTKSIEEEDESKKEKKLSMSTSYDICICSKLPFVIPIAPPLERPPPVQPHPEQPCSVCYQDYPELQDMPRQEMPRSLVPLGIPPMQLPMPMQQHMQQPMQQSMQQIMQQPMLQPCHPPCTPMPMQPMMGQPPTEERLNSVKKLVELENKLLMKQHHTKQKIDLLQNTVEKFKRELVLEKQRNSDLVSRYTNQSKTVENMKVEMDLVKKENYQDKRKLQHLNSTLKNILQGRAMLCQCGQSSVNTNAPKPGIPHFHTDLSLIRMNDNRYKQSVVKKDAKFPCSCGDKSSDSFEIDE